MHKEFIVSLNNPLFLHKIVMVDKEIYDTEDRVVIVAFWSLGDVVDFFPSGNLAYENNPNFDLVPTTDKVRLYMRYKSLYAMYKLHNPKRGNIFFNFYFQVILPMEAIIVFILIIKAMQLHINLYIWHMNICSKMDMINIVVMQSMR